MKFSARAATTVLTATLFSSIFAQTWCGKNFMENQPVVPPGGQFALPANSTEPLVAFRCSPAFRPYLEGDAKNAAFIIDALIVYQFIQGASPVSLSNPGSDRSEYDALRDLKVTISIDDQVLTRQQVPLNTTGNQISVDLGGLSAQKTPYNVSCSATYQTDSSGSSTAQYFSANTSLLYLPDTNVSVVKTDLRTGALWARPLNYSSGDFQPFVPQGFYVSFDQYLANNLSTAERLKVDGFNTIHPIPPYDNITLFQQFLNETIELGLYVIFDMRSTYQNLTAVAQQVEAYSLLPNLLLWETAHEPDGNSDPLDATQNTYDLIYQLDGYHPVSIVLNCQDYNFAPYVQGADIVLENAYPVSINATFSPVWHTPCSVDFGHCGCDDCSGNLGDVKARVQTFKDRLDILGYDRSKAVWTTPQAFGSVAYWNTTPTGQQWAAMLLTSFSHGATGSMSFQYPTTTGGVTTIEGTATNLTVIITEFIQPFVTDARATHKTFSVGGVDAGLWHNGSKYLLIATNFNSSSIFTPWSSIGLETLTSNLTDQIQRVFSVSQNTNVSGLNSRPGGLGIYTATPPV